MGRRRQEVGDFWWETCIVLILLARYCRVVGGTGSKKVKMKSSVADYNTAVPMRFAVYAHQLLLFTAKTIAYGQ